MTFIIGHDKLLEPARMRDVGQMVSHLYLTGDFPRLKRLREMLVDEQLEKVDTFTLLPSDRREQLKARVRGEQWKLTMEIGRVKDEMERLAILAAGFWDGTQILTAIKDPNIDGGGYQKPKG